MYQIITSTVCGSFPFLSINSEPVNDKSYEDEMNAYLDLLEILKEKHNCPIDHKHHPNKDEFIGMMYTFIDLNGLSYEVVEI